MAPAPILPEPIVEALGGFQRLEARRNLSRGRRTLRYASEASLEAFLQERPRKGKRRGHLWAPMTDAFEDEA